MTHLLIAPQYSNYNRDGIYMLHADSTANMTFNKLRVMLQLDPEFTADVLVPPRELTQIQPEDLTASIPGIERVTFLRHGLAPNAARTRYDFRYEEMKQILASREKYTHAYIMDPMHVRNYKALFFLELKYMPKIVCNSHFIDDPDNPVVAKDIQYWFGQVEGHVKADLNVWQCKSAQDVFERAAIKHGLNPEFVEGLSEKSYCWDAGYSHYEMSQPVNEVLARKRFLRDFSDIDPDKFRVFVPNRMGGKINGVERSLDYTNAGKFVLEVTNDVWTRRQDFVVIAGNPNQKITNAEIEERVPAYFRMLRDGTFEREEYRYVAKKCDIVVGAFTVDSYGGTAWRECVDQGCMPVLADCYEQHVILEAAQWPMEMRIRPDLSNMASALEATMDYLRSLEKRGPANPLLDRIKKIVREECSFEETTRPAMVAMGML